MAAAEVDAAGTAPFATVARGARARKLREASGRLIESAVRDILVQDLEGALGAALVPDSRMETWLAAARARLAARFSEEARRLHREVMHAHRAGELVASLDDAHHGVAAHSRAVAAELLSSPAGPGAEAEAVSVEGVEEDLRLQAKRMQLDLLRRQVQQQARQNAEQEHRNAAAMEEIEAHLTKLDDETGSLMATLEKGRAGGAAPARPSARRPGGG